MPLWPLVGKAALMRRMMAAMMGMAAWGGQQPQTKYWDNVTGLPLETWRVERAREDEIKFFQKQGVYDKVSRTVCYAKTGRSPVRVRWVDVNKGDEQNPDYRSRLVAMEFKTDSSAEWFSGTPPLEALRFVCVQIGRHRARAPRRTEVVTSAW